MCWVLDGLLRCACARLREYVREDVRVRAMSVCVCACAHLCVCSFACVRACPCVHACLCGRMCVRLCVAIGLRLRARVCSDRVCVRLAAACALPSHGGDLRYLWLDPRRASAAARAWLFSVPPAGLARVGRRCHVDEPHGQRGMGSARFAHVRGRRRRRHLRPRRRQRRRRLPQRRVREHRRRCAAELSRWGQVGGYSTGVLEWVLRGY